MEQTKLKALELNAAKARLYGVQMVHDAASGHPGGSMSCMDVLTYLYFAEMHVDPKNPHDPDRDRFVMSKGHCSPALYGVLAEAGFIPKEDIKTFRHIDSYLQGHPDMKGVNGVDMSTGSLGQGISAACGMAVSGKMDGKSCRVYTMLGDGEIEEGQVWEAAMLAAHKKLDNLVVLVDNNKMQIDGLTENVCGIEDVASKFDAFGFNTVRVNGNDEEEIDRALCEADNVKGRPTCIVMDTVKGEGVSIFKNMGFANHSCNVSAEQLETALAELED